VVLLAGIAGVVSYRHMHALAVAHGESACTAMLIPLSVDGMVVAWSMTLLADSRAGRRGGLLPCVLLAVGSAASLGANVAVAEPTVYGRVIAAWPSFALIAAYELLMRQIRLVAVMTEADRGIGAAGRVVPAAERRSGVRPLPVAGAVQPVVTAGFRQMDADLVARARQLDADHRARHDRPASAETIRRQLRIGAQRARDLKIMLRAGNSQPTTPDTA
jgi:hypothetical protein